MSDFTVAVFTEDEHQSVDDLLDPFYVGNETEPYVDVTKEELILRERTRMQDTYNNSYSKWQSDPEEYEKSAGNAQTI